MFPVPEKPDLSIGDIADYWSRETPATQRELRETMIGAWWGGTLQGPKPTKRLEALKVFVEQAERGEVAFLPGGTQDPPEIVEWDDRVDVDLRVRVPLPEADPESWTDASCADAFEVLGKDWTEDMCEELVVGLRAMTIARVDFMDWIERSDFAAPKFWGGKRSGKQPPKYMAVRAILDFVDGYLRAHPTATMDETVKSANHKASAAGNRANRDEVRKAYIAYRNAQGGLPRGRRANPPA